MDGHGWKRHNDVVPNAVFRVCVYADTRLVHHGEDASGMVMPQAAMGVTVRDGRMGTVYKAMEGAKMPNQNLPRVIQLPKQILLHLEVCCTL